MKRIGLISDTHGFIDQAIYTFFENCDEIWHAGDFGNIETADCLNSFKSLRGVFGNIDGPEIRTIYKKHLRFKCEGVNVWITHIGGYPGSYDRCVKPGIYEDPPDLFISGHSHILKVIFDEKLNLLHINPGAAGNYGLHHVKTLVKFVIDGKKILDLEVMEIKRNREIKEVI
jgi:uncharacterized protein